ncbi:SDR family NAD(P)-dependent oxidoreductase [Streptomyces sp. NPDC058891]
MLEGRRRERHRFGRFGRYDVTGTSKRVVITGGSRGIGREIALRFADSGAGVVVNYAGNREAADSTVADLQAGLAGGPAYQRTTVAPKTASRSAALRPFCE